jgi:hypothetical protein
VSARSQTFLALAAMATLAMAPAAGARGPVAHGAKNSPKCTEFITASKASAALGVAVKKPQAQVVADLVDINGGSVDGSQCDFYPVAPTEKYRSGEPIVEVSVEAHVTVGQFHEFVEHESTGTYFTGGTLTHPARLGPNADLDTLSQGELDRAYIVVLKGHDLFTVYSEELTTEANLVALAADVYKKI